MTKITIKSTDLTSDVTNKAYIADAGKEHTFYASNFNGETVSLIAVDDNGEEDELVDTQLTAAGGVIVAIPTENFKVKVTSSSGSTDLRVTVAKLVKER